MLIQLNKKMKKNKGFTLIELLVVVAIIAVLAVIAIPRFASMSENARVSAWTANHRTIVSGISMYAAANDGTLPLDGNAAALAALEPYVADLESFTGWGTALSATPAGASYVWTNTGGVTELRSTYGTHTPLVYEP